MKCISCGSEVYYDAKSGKLKCDSCKNEFDPKTYNKSANSAKKVDTYTGKGFKCSCCGAQLLVFDETAATFCSYCGSNSIIEEKLISQEKPEFVIPFKISKEEAPKLLQKELKKYNFLPKYMKDSTIIEKIRGIYIPYGIYTINYDGPATLKGNKSHRIGDYIYIDDYDINFDLKLNYEGMSYDLLSKFYDRYSERVAPFNFKEAEKFNTNYLSGYYVDCKDLDINLYDDDVIDFVGNDATKKIIKSDIEFRSLNCKNNDLKLSVSDRKYAYFPIYFLAIRDTKNNKLLYAIINGQTGEVVIDTPIDFKKYLLFGLFSSIIVFILTSIFCSFKPITLIISCFIFFIISLFVGNDKINKTYRLLNNLDDKGIQKENIKKSNNKKSKNKIIDYLKYAFYIFIILFVTSGISSLSFDFFSFGEIGIYNFIGLLSIFALIIFLILYKSNKKKYGNNSKQKIKYLWKQLLGILVVASLLVYVPINDEYYYIMSIVLFIITMLSFKDLIDIQNMLCLKELPQLEERGGNK